MITDEMVEKAAEAVHDFKSWDEQARWNGQPYNYRQSLLVKARVALTAALEGSVAVPVTLTEDMIEAAYQSVKRDDLWCIEDADAFAKAFKAALAVTRHNCGGEAK